VENFCQKILKTDQVIVEFLVLKIITSSNAVSKKWKLDE